MPGKSPTLVINFFNILKETIGLFILLCLQKKWFQWGFLNTNWFKSEYLE